MPEISQTHYSSDIIDSDIRLTRTAEDKMTELMSTADDELEAVRIFVMGGGCGGMSYGMTYAEGITAYDSVLEREGFKLAVDAVALNYLRGCTIDFVDNSFQFKDVFQAVGGSGVCGGCGGGGF